MALNNWDVKTSDILYKRFGAGEFLVSDLEALAKEKGIREAIITSCIGSLSQLKNEKLVLL
ncbi:MAG: hypothetical protein CM1200mP15_22010 [Dehalococcoidia bacterium]|nr:MAG: hypothetical protein CM1200mP15_22010 [Dehalococcoidia bacterium]